MERGSLLEEIKVLNQDLLICCKTGTALVLKLDIDFITLWDDCMQDGSVTIINIFELFKQTALAGSERDAFNYFVNNYKTSIKKAKFDWNKPFFFQLWFLLNPLQAVTFLCPPENSLMFSWGIEKELWTEMCQFFSWQKFFSQLNFERMSIWDLGGQLCKKIFFWVS